MLSDLHMFTLSQHSAPPLDGGRLPAQRGQQANSHQKLQARAPVKACDPRKKKKKQAFCNDSFVSCSVQP